RDFFGFNRAKHAVVEAAILATRTGLLPADEIEAEFRRLAVPGEKTGGPPEHAAFDFLRQYVRKKAGGGRRQRRRPPLRGRAARPLCPRTGALCPASKPPADSISGC